MVSWVVTVGAKTGVAESLSPNERFEGPLHTLWPAVLSNIARSEQDEKPLRRATRSFVAP